MSLAPTLNDSNRSTPVFGASSGMAAIDTSADLSAMPGPTPSKSQYTYVAEFDAIYGWAAGSVVPVDTFRVIGHTGGVAGRWILLDDGITMAPSRGATWTSLGAAMTALAYHGSITMAAEAWTADVAVITPNGTHLIIREGATINGTIALSPGTIAQNAIFYNNGGTTAPTASTTLTANAAAGAVQLALTSAVGFNVGSWFRILEGAAYTRTYKILTKVGNTITIDRPLRRPFTIAAAVVEAIPACRDITIEGNGVAITGQADACVQYASGVNCHLLDLFPALTTAKFQVVYDLGTRDSTMDSVHADSGGVIPTCILLANNEEVDLYDCTGIRAGGAGAPTNLFIPSSDNVRTWGGTFTVATNNMTLAVEDASDPFGTRGASFHGTFFGNATGAGILVQNGSSDNTWVGVEVAFCQTGYTFAAGGNAANNNTLVGGVIRGHSQVGILNALGDNFVQGVDFRDNLVGCATISAGTLAVTGGKAIDTVASGAQGLFLVSGATARLVLMGIQGSTTRNAVHLVETAGGGFVQIGGGARYIGVGANDAGLFMNGPSTAHVDDFTVVAPFGLYLNNAAAYCRRGDGVNVAGCATPYTVGPGAFNFGQVALNGNAAVAVGFGDTNAQDRFFYSVVAFIGAAATGALAAGAPVAGVGFSIVAMVATDISTIDYEIR